MRVRLYTLEEANAMLPFVRERIDEGRRVLAEMREHAAQLNDLKLVYGEALAKPDCPERDAYRHHQSLFEAKRSELGDLVAEFAKLGIEVKDLDLGLVDFHADRAGEIVYLCWRVGESEVRHWHTMEGGFAGRKPLGELADLQPST